MAQKREIQKSIIINWDWHKSIVCDNDLFDNTWHTGAGDILSCSNVKKDNILDIIPMAQYYVQKGPVLIFLHKNTPHNSTESDLLILRETLKPSLMAYEVRVRLFGGGTEPIYYIRDKSNGIVGTRGINPDKGTFPENYSSVDKEKNFIIDKDQKLINQAHYDHVWNAYWHTPKNNVYNLMEEFRFYTDGFDWTMDNADAKFLTHLADYPSLWYKLHSFAGVPIEDNQQPEYAIEAYMAHLQHTNNKVTLTLIENTRKDIAQIITGGKTAEEMQTLIKKSYNNLYQCFKEIPLYL